MGRDDWDRNQEWNPEIEALFFDRLKRARRKAQYLRIQACMLATSHPQTALVLLDQYFGTGDTFDLAQAYVDQAQAYLALADIERALDAYELALAREEDFPNVKTQAYVDFAFLIATAQRRDRYDRALNVLAQNRQRPLFPADRFKWHAAHALILADAGNISAARKSALAALEDASAEHSGFRYHPSIGLVGSSHKDLRERLATLARSD